MTKSCPKCLKEKSPEDRGTYCKQCQKEYNRQRAASHPGRNRNRNRNKEEESSYQRKSRAEKPEVHRKYGRDFLTRHPEAVLLRSARTRTRKSGIPFSITRKDIKIPDLCPILGFELQRGKGKICFSSPTLDRISPKLGYVSGNIAVLSHRANTIKNNGTADEHRRIADWMEKSESFGVCFEGNTPSDKTARCLLDHARKRAKAKGVDFSLRKKDILIPDLCPILGIPLFQGKEIQTDNSPSLDRFDPELGYTIGNVTVVSLRANQIKSLGSAEEHRKIAAWMDSQIQHAGRPADEFDPRFH